MTKTTKRLVGLKKALMMTLAVIPMSAIIVAGGTVSASATPDVMDQIQHFVDCFGWMITDPAQHEANCAPGHIPPYSPNTVTGQGGFVSTTIVTLTEQ